VSVDPAGTFTIKQTIDGELLTVGDAGRQPGIPKSRAQTC